MVPHDVIFAECMDAQETGLFMHGCILLFTFFIFKCALNGNYFACVTYSLRKMDCNLY
jgi:hypothetical protein